jgi:hypothetical protein
MRSYITTTQALKIILEEAPAPVTLVTLITWCQKYGLGYKMGGRWFIHEVFLREFIRDSNQG